MGAETKFANRRLSKEMARYKPFVLRYRGILLLFGTALLLRFVFLGALALSHSSGQIIELFSDSVFYNKIAFYLLGWRPNGEEELLLTGPGYGVFLAFCYTLFGDSVWPVLVIQALLSSLSCILIYWVAQLLFPTNGRIALLAGIIAVFSLTSISLSGTILSDTLSFTIFGLVLVSLFKGIQENRWRWFLVAGLLNGIGTLSRGILEFWSLATVFVLLMIPASHLRWFKRDLVFKAVGAALITFAILLPWAWRNYQTDGILTISEIGTRTARDYWTAAVASFLEPTKNLDAVRAEWNQAASEKYGQDISFAEKHSEDVRIITTMLREHPQEMGIAFLIIAASNVVGVDTLLPFQFPQPEPFWETWNLDSVYAACLVFLLSIIGTGILYRSGQVFAATWLVTIFLYFALLSGFTFWQGSRIFYPAQYAWIPLVAVVLERVSHWHPDTLRQIKAS